MNELRFEIAPDAERAARAAAQFVAARAAAAVDERGVFTVAFSGGSTPARMLELLGELAVPWAQMHVFQVDERVAPDGDPARNLLMLEAGLLLADRLPAANLHPMPVQPGSGLQSGFAAATHAYEEQLQKHCGLHPILDLVHLGLGDDGHTASLVPGDEVLAITDRDVAMTADYRGHRRMTLTYPAIDRARARLWLATGAGKGIMLARLRDADPAIPAGRVQGENSLVFCDRAAADSMT